MSEIILKVKNFSVSFGLLKVVENLSFEVERGQTIAIIGPNGAGKTVLLRALIGVVSYEGEVEWDKKIKIGYVPQRLDLDPQLPITLGDMLLLKAKVLGLPSFVVNEVMQLVHLGAEDFNVKLINLPAGKLQRALIAMALIGDPDILLFDEPTSGVDLPREELIYETLHELQDKKGISLMLVSHDLNLVYKHATQVLCLNRQMLCFGEPQKALTSELLTKLYGDRVLYHHPHDSSSAHHKHHE